MPTQTPTSFASAAAANGSNEGPTNGRGLGGTTDWTRSRPNGATQTFRRPSQANTSTTTQRDGSQQNNAAPASGVYVPPHLNTNYSSFSRLSANMESRYSKDQLLDLFRSHSRGNHSDSLASLLTEGWTPGVTSASSNGGWSRREETKDGQVGADICWDSNGQVQPLGLTSMGEEERDLFSTSVNSPLKPPPQNATKDNTSTPGPNGRKLSTSQAPNTNGSQSTVGQPSRPGPRRRDTNDSLNNPLVSPSPFNQPSRDETLPPASLIRRKTDVKQGGSGSLFGERPKLDTALDTNSPFNNLKRTATGPMSAALNGPSSPWGNTPQSAGFGAFGNFSLEGGSAQPTTPGEKRVGFGSLRGESRFKGLMSKESAEDVAARQKEKPVSGLEKLRQSDIERQSSKWGQTRPNRPVSKDSDEYGEPATVGSAALGGDESSPSLQSRPSNLEIQQPHDEIGFSSFGAQGDAPSFRDSMSQRDLGVQETPHAHRYNGGNAFEPTSPTNTNPYQSPEADRSNESHENDDDNVQLPYVLQGNLQKSHAASFERVDRSQTSSTGAQRGFPTFGGLGGIGGLSGAGPWSAAPGTIGTPSKATPGFPSGFGESLFGSMGDHNPPGGMFGAPSSNAFANVGRSKMGSLFPAQMQDQMRLGDASRGEQVSGDAGSGRNAPGGINVPLRDTESPAHHSRGVLDDLFGNVDRSKVSGASSFNANDGGQAALNSQGNMQPPPQQTFSTASSIVPIPAANPSSNNVNFFERSPEPDAAGGVSNQIPPAQQRQMVMPDRMRWVYRDPQGVEQGPFSGLEMHDWYKAGFFSPELQVKKIEDNEHEPLAQLIRRIGNSREPFLVPQIGIPHGPANPQGASNGSGILGAPNSSNNVQSGSAQPPFASSFPSFGTTLTADQQNALERRKQEEQYLMARQKEHLVQHQLMQKQYPHPGIPHPMHPQLQHHSSAHSLQSQPSYGSITSPSGYQPSPIQMPPPAPGGMPGFFDAQQRPGMGNIGFPGDSTFLGRDNEIASSMDRLNLGRTVQPPYGNVPSQGQQEGLSNQQQVASIIQDRARLQREQEHYDALQRGGLSEGNESLERFEQFQQLRAQEDEQSLPPGGVIGQPRIQDTMDKHMANNMPPAYEASLESSPPPSTQDDQGVMLEDPHTSQKVAPPLPSSSPLPAPAAQRNRQYIADNLAAESGSRSQTPSADTPTATLAPWAKENADGPRGPSLKEIQEAEASKTAQQEEIAAATRRTMAEQERLAASQVVPPAPGLPSTANWATGTSPVTASGGPSAWTKPLAGKAATPNTTKKTLAQIQKEEEARKNRAAVAAAAAAAAIAATNSSNVSSATIAPGGKRYADLASKVAAPNPMMGGGAWTTVGAGGKAKAPIGSGPVPMPTQRTVSSGTSSTPSVVPKVKSAMPSRSNTAAAQSAQDEFQKWAKSALSKGLNAGINVDDFVRNLLQLPIDAEVLSEAIYANSETLDGHRFAEEFIRRRKLADKGVAPEVSSSANFSSGGIESKNAGGWSEVAKKIPSNAPKEETSSAFKVVAAKKKGKR